MTGKATPNRLITHSHRLVNLLNYLLIFIVSLRRVNGLEGTYSIPFALLMLSLFTILYTCEPLLTRRFPAYHQVYYAVQMILVQMLGIFKPYLDTWALLYIVLGFQAAMRCRQKVALTWGGLFAASTLITITLEFGLISGLGRASAILVIGIFIISYNIQYSRHEEALVDSQVLLAELQEAHQKLTEFAIQNKKLAAAQEHDRLIREMYDSVGQKVFALQLAGEAARLMLDADPARAAGQIDDLQSQTQAALVQMRQLIDEWRTD